MKSQFHMRLNNQPVTNGEPDVPVNTAVSFNRVWIGINHIADNQVQPVTVYYDDLVVDTRDIACE